jgi:hypothetical protein
VPFQEFVGVRMIVYFADGGHREMVGECPASS